MNFPCTVHIEDKWRIAVGVHPKKVSQLTEEQWNHFFRLIRSTSVTAIDEIGLERSGSTGHWQEQQFFGKAYAVFHNVKESSNITCPF